jgi:hypothetical protein
VHTEPVTPHRLRRRIEGRAAHDTIVDRCAERAECELHHYEINRHAYVLRRLGSPDPDRPDLCPDPSIAMT